MILILKGRRGRCAFVLVGLQFHRRKKWYLEAWHRGLKGLVPNARSFVDDYDRTQCCVGV